MASKRTVSSKSQSDLSIPTYPRSIATTQIRRYPPSHYKQITYLQIGSIFSNQLWPATPAPTTRDTKQTT